MLNVTPIPAFSDNYIWCMQRDGEKQAVVVDPGDGQAVLDALAARGLTLAGIIITHHHFDHTGGIDTLLGNGAVPVYGPQNPDIPQIGHRLSHGDQVDILGACWDVLEVPGHTLDHIAFFHRPEDADPLLFCGDTLFAGGCGRVFEGDPGMMLASLDRLAALPDNTRVFCAHEYTLANLRFAAAVEPDNTALQARIQDDQSRRDRGEPTVPSTLALERRTNPFLRCREPAVAERMAARNAIDASDATAVFAAVRGWKDEF
ncbi:MAG: hydroxyacylglutathione hydrolase [Halieaceae bacterium]|jgi:hydroxyacylglutathione hydrolase|nr:hydroxyacylglutathione hydrolase [Halieaceae bacterium]